MLGLHRLLRRWHARKGRLVVLPSVPSPELDNRRDLYTYGPAAPARGDSRYPVIYMQDGQNLFDPALSFAGTWGVDEALSWASRRGLDAIVVGIPNMGDARIAEYDPFMGTGDRYLDFVTHTVKPVVDAQFPTLPDRRHTGIAGSSMGGLISMYAFFRYSESFGFAAALSPSLWFADGALLDLVARAPRVPGRLYLDVGMREGQQTVALGRRLRDLLLAKGYEGGATFAGWRTRTVCTTSRRGAVASERPSRSCCRTGRREARVPQVAQPCAGARHGAPGAGICGRAGPGVPHVAGQLFRVDRPPDGSTGRAGRAPRERLDPDVLSPPRARGELVRRAPAAGSASLASFAVRPILAGRGDPVQRRPEPEPVRDRGGCELRSLSRGVLRPAQSPPCEPHHRPLRTVRHHPADRRVLR